MAHGNSNTRAGRTAPLAGAALLAVFAALCADAEEPASGAAASARAVTPVAATLPAPPAGGDKKHKRIDLKPPPGAKLQVFGMLNSGQITDQDAFDGWWHSRMAEITQAEYGSQLAELRKKLKQEMQRAKDPARQKAVAILLDDATKIVRDAEFSPAARISAVLILGDLNQVEPNFQGLNALPLPAAQTELIRIVKDPKVGDMQDALRAAALVGLQRHAETTLPDAAKQQVSSAMKELAASDEPPEGRSAEVHGWITARARGVLSSLGVDANVRAEPAP